MLRAKKFSIIKNQPIYRFLNEVDTNHNDSITDKIETMNFYSYYFQLYFVNDFESEIIKTSVFLDIDYTINRQESTNTWMLVCDKLIVIDLPKDYIEEFCLSYSFSSVYRFVILEYSNGYIAICTSHVRNDIDDILKFQVINNSKSKYVLLSQFIRPDLYKKGGSSFIILNKSVKGLLNNDDKTNDLYKIYDTIGYGIPKVELDEFVKIIINYARAFKNYPINYMNI